MGLIFVKMSHDETNQGCTCGQGVESFLWPEKEPSCSSQWARIGLTHLANHWLQFKTIKNTHEIELKAVCFRKLSQHKVINARWKTKTMSNTSTERQKEFPSSMFSIIVVWALIQPEAGFMFGKGSGSGGSSRNLTTLDKNKRNVPRPDVRQSL